MASKQFRPEVLPRRGEIIAWSLTILMVAAWLFLSVTKISFNWVVPTTALLLLLSALSISLSNWMDRNTILFVDLQGVTFQNGLRRIELQWNDITQVSVFETNLGKKIQIFGPDSQFSFHTLKVVERNGQVPLRSGFVEGEKILREVVESAKLKVLHRVGSGYYYARE